MFVKPHRSSSARLEIRLARLRSRLAAAIHRPLLSMTSLMRRFTERPHKALSASRKVHRQSSARSRTAGRNRSSGCRQADTFD
jgi:hypothetical protein